MCHILSLKARKKKQIKKKRKEKELKRKNGFRFNSYILNVLSVQKRQNQPEKTGLWEEKSPKEFAKQKKSRKSPEEAKFSLKKRNPAKNFVFHENCQDKIDKNKSKVSQIPIKAKSRVFASEINGKVNLRKIMKKWAEISAKRD